MPAKPAYLGDGVYIGPDPGGLVLTTGDHNPNAADSVVYLDPDIARKLRDYLTAAIAEWEVGNG